MIRKTLVLLCFLITFVASGQDEFTPPDPNEDPDIPIPGIGILLAAGAAFGAKKAYDIYRRRGK